MSTSREQSKEIVDRVLSGDPEAFKEFYKQYDRLVWEHTLKWSNSICSVSMNMYESYDVHNELWEHIWKSLPKYDYTRANLVSWLYLICTSKAGMMYRNLKTSDCYPWSENIYLHDTVLDKDGDNVELIDMIMDPQEAFENMCLDEVRLHDYLYTLKDFIQGLGRKQKIVYLQGIRHNMTERDISSLVGISQSYVSRIRNKMMAKAVKLWERVDCSRIDHAQADKFALALVGPETDDELSDQLSCDLAVIKICREVLTIADLYSGNGELLWG